MSVASLKAPKESLDGTSLMGELGWKYCTSSIPLIVDLNASGWTGERLGVSGRVFCSYEF